MKHLITLLFTVLALASCSSPRALEYRSVQNFRVHELGLSKSTIGMQVVYYNPNEFALDLKGGNIDVFLNSTYVGKAGLDSLVSVAGNSNFVVPMRLSVDMQQLAWNAAQLLLKPEVELKLQGSIQVGRGSIFIPVPVNIVTKQRIEIR